MQTEVPKVPTARPTCVASCGLWAFTARPACPNGKLASVPSPAHRKIEVPGHPQLDKRVSRSEVPGRPNGKLASIPSPGAPCWGQAYGLYLLGLLVGLRLLAPLDPLLGIAHCTLKFGAPSLERLECTLKLWGPAAQTSRSAISACLMPEHRLLRSEALRTL